MIRNASLLTFVLLTTSAVFAQVLSSSNAAKKLPRCSMKTGSGAFNNIQLPLDLLEGRINAWIAEQKRKE